MGYRGTLRTIGAIARSMERDAKRRQREYERRQKELAKMQELERARHEVNVYENYLDVITSLHKECGNVWDWEKIKVIAPPSEPIKKQIHEQPAQKALDSYSPSFFDKLFKRIEKKKDKLVKKLEEAKNLDRAEYQTAFKDYKKDFEEWKCLNDIAKKICEGDIDVYTKAIKEINPFEEIQELGSSIKFEIINKDHIVANIKVHPKDVIPKEEKSFLKSGKLSVKTMSTAKFNELYQDYVCSTVIRVARELFALLPLKISIINAYVNMLNTKTGHMEDMPILSVAILKEKLAGFNFGYIDPSDSMENFVHQMDFKKAKGFIPVEILDPQNFK